MSHSKGNRAQDADQLQLAYDEQPVTTEFGAPLPKTRRPRRSPSDRASASGHRAPHEPQTLTSVLTEEVVLVLVSGYSVLTRSPMTVIERADGKDKDAVESVGRPLYRNPVCEAIAPRAGGECRECDKLHSLALLNGDIRQTTAYLCPFGQVDVAVPVRIGARTVAAFYGGQVPFEFWPQEGKAALIDRAISDGYLDGPPAEPSEAGREALTRSLERLGISDLDVDELLAMARVYMRDVRGEPSMVQYVRELEEKGRIIERLANHTYFASLLQELGDMVEEEPLDAAAPEGDALDASAEPKLWDTALRAMNLVRRTMGLRYAVLFANSEDTPTSFEVTRAIALRGVTLRHAEKRKGPLLLDLQLLREATAGSQSIQYRRRAHDIILDSVREWLPALGEGPVRARAVKLDDDVKRFALLVLSGAEPAVADIQHPVEREPEELEKMLSQLAASVERRFAALALRQRAQRQASFTLDLSHELKAPFQAVLAQAQRLISLVRSGRPSGKDLDQISTRLSTERNEVHIRMANVSILSPQETRQLNKELTRLGSVVTGSVERHKLVAKELAISVSYTEALDPDKMCFVNVDDESFVLAVDNLLQNAIKYSYPGTTIQVKVVEASDSVSLHVANVGARVPESKYKDIFRRFTRLSPEEMQFGSRPGTGIGLAVVQAIVNMHDGSVSVKSGQAPSAQWPLEHQGPPPHLTTFTIRLPR